MGLKIELLKMTLAQVIFGAVLFLVGLFLITPGNVTQDNVYVLSIAVAILFIKDGLVMLANAGIANMKQLLQSFNQKPSEES